MPLIFQIISFASIFSVVPPLILSLIGWKRAQGPLKLLCWLLVISFTADLLAFVLMSQGLKTMVVLNAFLIGQFIIVSLLIYRELEQRKSVLIVSSMAILFFLFDLFFFAKPTDVITYGSAAFNAVGIIYIMIYLRKVLNELPFEDITSTPIIWAIFGVMAFYCGTFFILLFDKILLQFEELRRNAWIVSPLSNIIKNAMFAVALWINLKSKK